MIKQERAERTREAIIRAAAAVFERDGFTAAPLGDITRRATVTKGALYFHFSSKRELAHAVVDEAADTVHWLLGEARRRQGAELPLQVLINLSHALIDRLAGDQVLRAGLRLGTDADLYPDHDRGLSLDWAAMVDEVLSRPDAGSRDCDGPGSAPGLPAPRLGKDALACVLTGLELLFRRSPQLIEQGALTSVWRLLLPGLAASGDVGRYQPSGSGRAPA